MGDLRNYRSIYEMDRFCTFFFVLKRPRLVVMIDLILLVTGSIHHGCVGSSRDDLLTPLRASMLGKENEDGRDTSERAEFATLERSVRHFAIFLRLS